MNQDIIQELIRNAFFQIKHYFDVIGQLSVILDTCRTQVVEIDGEMINSRHFFTQKMLQFNSNLSKIKTETTTELKKVMSLIVEEDQSEEASVDTLRLDMELKQSLSMDFSSGNQVVKNQLNEKLQQFIMLIDESGMFNTGKQTVQMPASFKAQGIFQHYSSELIFGSFFDFFRGARTEPSRAC